VPDISARAAGYGVPGVVVDGSDPAAVYEVMQNAVERARAGHGPTLIEAKVTRLQGHYVADQQTYRPDAATVAATKDPYRNFSKLVGTPDFALTRLRHTDRSRRNDKWTKRSRLCVQRHCSRWKSPSRPYA
jgi:TPP-dependent pyruvate/acetoin dehydrogenase alpha subunit